MTTKKKAQGAEDNNGGEVWDLVKVAQEQEKAARAFLRLIDLPGLPGVLSDNLYNMLSHAAKVCDVPIGSENPHGGYCAKQVAVLFAVLKLQRGGLTFEPARDPSADLAALISAVLNHPDTPTPIHNKLSEAVGEYVVRDEVAHAPEVLRVALAVYKAEREAEADDEKGSA